MRPFIFIFIFIIAGCHQPDKSIEHYRKKETLNHSDLTYIINAEYNLASEGLHLLGSSDTSALRKAAAINSQIEEWEEVRKKNEQVELTKEELDQLETIISFRQIFIRRMNEALQAD